MYRITRRIVAFLTIMTIGLTLGWPSHSTSAAELQRPKAISPAVRPSDHTSMPLSAARSFSIRVENSTGRDWVRINWGLSHGTWSVLPPENLPKVFLDDDGNAHPGVITFGSESDGFATGTQGFVVYRSSAGNLRIDWNNPFVGSNSFSVAVPSGYRATWTSISGNNANVTVRITKP